MNHGSRRHVYLLEMISCLLAMDPTERVEAGLRLEGVEPDKGGESGVDCNGQSILEKQTETIDDMIWHTPLILIALMLPELKCDLGPSHVSSSLTRLRSWSISACFLCVSSHCLTVSVLVLILALTLMLALMLVESGTSWTPNTDRGRTEEGLLLELPGGLETGAREERVDLAFWK